MSVTTPDPTDTMRKRMQTDLRAAMKSRDAAEIAVLRCLIAALDNAGAIALAPAAGPVKFVGSEYVATGLAWGSAEATRRPLSAAEVDGLIAREVAAREAAAAEFERLGRSADAGVARLETAIAVRYRAPADNG